ncbi:MAG: TlpA family protein disulfide reductase [Acidobacteria bacterium]|nr:TlpA family protein disulfide reductase [Acidobacteriota bacterium]
MRSLGWFSLSLLLAGSLAAADQYSNRRAPGFSLPDLNLKQHDLADYRGRVVLIDIMKTDCPHCRTLSKQLEQVKARYGQRVAILSVVTPPDNQQTVLRYIQANFLTTPVLFDCGQMAASYLKVTPQNPTVNLPHLFIIDGQGVIRHDYSFEAEPQAFEGKALFEVLDRILAVKAVPTKKP